MRFMGKRPFFGTLSFGCALLLTTSTWAATLEPAQGDLTINQGQGFQPVNSRVDAKVGDSVMVGPGGTATLTYEDGCTVTVQPGSVTTIAPLSPCASGSYAQTGGGGFDWGGVVLGGLAAGLAGFGIYEISKSPDNGTPASP
jgi:hypothetical protein